MKKLEFESNGSKWLLIDATGEDIGVSRVGVNIGKYFYSTKEVITLKDITEDQASEVVDKSIHTVLFAHYVKDIPVNTYCYKNVYDSVKSFFDSKGVFLFSNPYDKYCGTIEYQESESKTFYNPILFKILS